METNSDRLDDALIDLRTTVRGIRLVAAPPDARYRRQHTDITPHPDETQVGRAVRVEQPARFADGTGAYPAGTLLCSAYTEWQVDGRRVDPCLHDESGRDLSGGRAAWTELECLECGAVYPAPGSVEPGGMSCRRRSPDRRGADTWAQEQRS